MPAPLPGAPNPSPNPAAALPGAAAAKVPPGTNEAESEPKKLTPEEQMALFEKDLKENDWGHQPC
jgi:hypothetical protein